MAKIDPSKIEYDPRFYRGVTPEGKMLLQPWFAASVKRAYAPSTAYAEDSAYIEDDINRDAGWDREAYYSALESEYARLRNQPCDQFNPPLSGLDVHQHARDTQRYGDEQMQTRITRDEARAVKRAQMIDTLPDEKTRYHFALEQAYRAIREAAAMLLIACLFVGVARAQVQPAAIFGGSPPLGGTCQFAPSGPAAFLTPAGAVITCALVGSTNAGFWTLSNGLFQTALPQSSPVTMNASDQTVFNVPLPPLPQSTCWNIGLSLSALSGATVTLKVDGTPVETLVTAATLSGGLSLPNVGLCNEYESQTAQLNFVRDALPTAVQSFWSGTFVPTNNINWSSGHVLTLTVNQPAGTITPLSFSIVEGN
jgi:hypothetical protein